MRRDEDAALKAASAMLAVEDEAEETETDESQETPEGEATQETVEEESFFPNWEVELPEDLEEELVAPTDEDVLQELEQDVEYQELDEESRRLLARARAAEKKVEFHEKQRLVSEKKNWVAEATKFFPLSEPFLSEINATSRRGFLRSAKDYHERVLPFVKPMTEKAQAEIKRLKEEATQEARDEAKERWGSTPKGTSTPTEAAISVEQLHRNREKGDLAATIRAMIFPTKES